jgi:hypothetical protein
VAKKIEPDEHRARSLEGPENVWVRDRKENYDRWAWARGVFMRALQFGTILSAGVFAVKALYDLFKGGTTP